MVAIHGLVFAGKSRSLKIATLRLVADPGTRSANQCARQKFRSKSDWLIADEVDAALRCRQHMSIAMPHRIERREDEEMTCYYARKETSDSTP
jgi:hypothetical protein